MFSGIEDYKAQTDFNYYLKKHKIKFGISSIYHNIFPSNVAIENQDTTLQTGNTEKLFALENGIYIQDELDIAKKLRVNAASRYSNFNHLGPFERYNHSKDVNGKELTDTVNYSQGSFINTYNAFEPRISMRYELDSTASIKASYTKNYQYLHLLSLSQLSLPTDVWYPSTSIVKPQIGDQIAVGYFRNFKDNTYETSVETYYKTLQNQIAYEEGYSPQDDGADNTDNSLVFGKGEAYGAEFLIKKNRGKLTGWVGYTLSYTKRQFDELNNGKEFFARYDRRHDISVVGMYQLSKKWNFGATWVFASGNRFTLPIGKYFIDDMLVNLYGNINNVNAKDYHRLDISATYTPQKQRKYESSWVFGIYNLYNRFNPYITTIESTGEPSKGNFKSTATEIAIFPIIPSVTWNFKF